VGLGTLGAPAGWAGPAPPLGEGLPACVRGQPGHSAAVSPWTRLLWRERCEKGLRGASSGSSPFGSGPCPCLSCVVLVPVPGHLPASCDPRPAAWLGPGPASSPRTCPTVTGLSAGPGYCCRTCSARLAWGLGDGDLAGEATTIGSVLTFPDGAASSICSLTLTCCYQWVAITGSFMLCVLQIMIYKYMNKLKLNLCWQFSSL